MSKVKNNDKEVNVEDEVMGLTLEQLNECDESARKYITKAAVRYAEYIHKKFNNEPQAPHWLKKKFDVHPQSGEETAADKHRFDFMKQYNNIYSSDMDTLMLLYTLYYADKPDEFDAMEKEIRAQHGLDTFEKIDDHVQEYCNDDVMTVTKALNSTGVSTKEAQNGPNILDGIIGTTLEEDEEVDLSNPHWNTIGSGHTWDMARAIANTNDAYNKDDAIFLAYMLKHIVRAGDKPYVDKTIAETKLIELEKAYTYLKAWIDVVSDEAYESKGD